MTHYTAELRSPTYRAAEIFALILTLSFLFNVGMGLLLGRKADVRAPFSSSDALAIQLVIYGMIGIFIIPWWRQILAALWGMKPIVLLLVFAGASAAWSHAPGVTLRRFPVIVATTVVGVYMGVRFSLPRQVRLIALTLGMAAAASVILAVLLPGVGVDHGIHSGDWQGIFEHKNMLGKMMSLGVAVTLVATSDSFRKRRVLAAITAFVAFALVIKSGSRTSWAVTFLLLACFGASKMRRWRITEAAPVVLFSILFAATGYVWLKSNTQTVLAASGRDATLSGRSNLWMAVGMAIQRRPLTGYGFDAFWMDDGGPDMIVIQNVKWNPPHAHNGLLDLILGLGYIGVAIFLCGFLITLFKALRTLRKEPSGYAVWPFLFMVFLVAYNVTESSLFAVNSFSWALYISVATTVWAVPKLPFSPEAIGSHE